MRFRQLECFVRACELGSFSRAAEQLNVAQPALGLQIRNLEHDFGVVLLVRSSRGVSPTRAGELLLVWARDVIQGTREVKERLRSEAQADVDTLSLGLSPSMTYLLAGTIVEEAGRSMPGLRLRVSEGLSHLLVEWVESARIDLALVTGFMEKPTLSQTPMLQEHLHLVTAASRNGKGPITFAEALALPLAMPGENDALRRIVEGEARKAELPLTVTYEIASITAIKDLVARGLASAILPYGAVRRESRAGELHSRRITDPSLPRTLFLVRLQDRAVGDHERRLVTTIKDCLSLMIDGEAATGSYQLL